MPIRLLNTISHTHAHVKYSVATPIHHSFVRRERFDTNLPFGKKIDTRRGHISIPGEADGCLKGELGFSPEYWISLGTNPFRFVPWPGSCGPQCPGRVGTSTHTDTYIYGRTHVRKCCIITLWGQAYVTFKAFDGPQGYILHIYTCMCGVGVLPYMWYRGLPELQSLQIGSL